MVARQDAPPPPTTQAEDADINTQINYIKKLLHKGRRFLIVPLDEDDDDDLDDKEEAAAAEYPLDTEGSHITAEGDIPDKVVGQIFVKTLSGNTITVNDVTTKTNIIDIKNTIEKKDGLPVKFQRLEYQGKKLKDNHTVGYYGIEKEHELHLNGRLRGGGGKRARASTPSASSANPFKEEEVDFIKDSDAKLFERVFVTATDKRAVNVDDTMKSMDIEDLREMSTVLAGANKTHNYLKIKLAVDMMQIVKDMATAKNKLEEHRTDEDEDCICILGPRVLAVGR